MRTIHVGDIVKFWLKKSWQQTDHLDGKVESVEFAPTYIVAVPVDYVRLKIKPRRYMVKAGEIEKTRGEEQNEDLGL
jgi:hypothetical protein